MTLGKWGETIASSYLKQIGYIILEQNFSCRLGELDLIVQKEKLICFVEVKTRRSLNFGQPCEAVTKKKQGHIHRTIQYYLMKKNPVGFDLRIDVIEILVSGSQVCLRHIPNAF